jgi:hypothetical protein
MGQRMGNHAAELVLTAAPAVAQTTQEGLVNVGNVGVGANMCDVIRAVGPVLLVRRVVPLTQQVEMEEGVRET